MSLKGRYPHRGPGLRMSLLGSVALLAAPLWATEVPQHGAGPGFSGGWPIASDSAPKPTMLAQNSAVPAPEATPVPVSEPAAEAAAPLPPEAQAQRDAVIKQLDASPASDALPAGSVPDAVAQGPAESLRDAIIDALKNNPDIQIALAQEDDARYGIAQSRAGYLPHVDLTVSTGPEYNEPYRAGDTTLRRSEGTISIRQNLWDFGTTINDIKRARALYRSARWATREQIEAIALDIASAYLSVLERQKLVFLTGNEIAAHEKILKMVSIQHELGLTTAADVSRAQARLDNVRAALLDRNSELQQARESYRRLVNRLPARAVDIPPPDGALPVDAEAAVAMIDTHSPRLAQAVEQRRSIDRQRASQNGTFFPRIGVEVQGNWKSNVQGLTRTNNDARAMVTMSYNIFNGGADLALRNRLTARLREADYELARKRREVEQDIRIDFSSLEAAKAKTVTIDSEIAAAERTAQLYREQFRSGKRSVFDLLDSQQILFNARSNAITNKTAMLVSEMRVLQKLGGLFDLLSGGEPLPKLVMPAPSK